MARYAGDTVGGLIDLAFDAPLVFKQILWDLEFSHELDEAKNGSAWRQPGETIKSARDRLREGREKAKRKLLEHAKGKACTPSQSRT